MLSVNDLIDIKYIPAENEISLQLLVEFYEKYLCKRIFIFTLRNGKVIKLFFRDATEIFHISGIDHIYEGFHMDGKRFLQEVKDGNIDLQTVEKINIAAYKDYIIRIRSMACLDTIIKNCEYLLYTDGKIPESTIEVKYLLLKGLDGKNLHLGIDAYNDKRPYFSRTLLVTEGNTADKFIGKADERLRVAKLEIRDKDTDNILISIDRELAEMCALEEISECASEWFLNEFPTLLSNYFISSASQDILSVWLQKKNGIRLYIKILKKKANVKTKIDDMDTYWSAKIVAEAIRKYEKEELDNKIVSQMQQYILEEGNEIIHSILVKMIYEKKGIISRQIAEQLA